IWDRVIQLAQTDAARFRSVYHVLTWLVDIFNELSDEVMQRLSLSIDHFELNDREAYQLSRTIYKLADSNLKNAGSLFVALLHRTDINPYSAAELHQLVSKLYASGNKETADNICHYMGDKKGSLI